MVWFLVGGQRDQRALKLAAWLARPACICMYMLQQCRHTLIPYFVFRRTNCCALSAHAALTDALVTSYSWVEVGLLSDACERRASMLSSEQDEYRTWIFWWGLVQRWARCV